MWTPWRILLTLGGLLMFAGGYVGYAQFLGRYDGLPPLPEHFKEVARPGTDPSPPLGRGSSLNRKFEMAFGRGCPEIDYPIKTELKGRRVLVAARDFKILKAGDPDAGPRAGWVRFMSLSLASLGEKRGAEGIPEINTLFADVAYIRFDKPIRAMTDLTDSAIVAAELHADPEAPVADARKGRIYAQNNRRTLDPNDDIEMETPGPLYYDAHPKPGRPDIYTFSEVHVTDHQNTGLPVPNRNEPRPPTVAGIGLSVFLAAEDKQAKKGPARTKDGARPVAAKEPDAGVSGVELVALDRAVEMNIWTDADASFVAPGDVGNQPKKEPPKPPAKKGAKAGAKRLLQIKTHGPFRYDLAKELAHFEKPAQSRPGLIDQVVVSREGRTVGFDTLACEVLDVQFQRKPPVPPKDEPGKVPPAPKKNDSRGDQGDLAIHSIRATGETVVMTSDSENLHATGTELTHDADAHVTVLKGSVNQPVQAVKDGNLIRGSEVHLFGNGKEITQAHVLGAGSVGVGELDPRTGEYFKQATWSDRMVYTREPGAKDRPPTDVLTFLGKDGVRARFRDTSAGQLQDLEAYRITVRLEPAPTAGKKKDPPAPSKTPDPKAKEANAGLAGTAMRPTRLEARGDVHSLSPEMVIRHADFLEVDFRDVDDLIKPRTPPKTKDPKATDPKAGPAVAKAEPPAAEPMAEPGPRPIEPKAGVAAKADPEPGAEPKKPLLVSSKTIHAWVNRDPKGHNELDHVLAEGTVRVHQDPANKDELGTDIDGNTVFMQAYKEGNRLVVTGIPGKTFAEHKWGVVRFDKLTMFGFDIVIDQRDNTSTIKGEGSMEIVSNTNLEGKKLANPTTTRIFWKHRMDFLGAEKLIYYHGGVQGYDEGSSLKCEWMQVLLDRPVILNQDLRAKTQKKRKPGEKSDSPNIDTVMCFHAPRDEAVPRPRQLEPVTVVQQEKDPKGEVIRFQSIQAPEVVTVNTPVDQAVPAKDGRSVKKDRKDLTATSSDTMPGTVRIWQAGQKDALAERPPPKKGEPKKDQEMQLTVVQFGGKMIANDFRKRAKFFNNIRVVHLPTDSPFVPVDLREGEIPKGAVYLECRDYLDVFSTEQMERNPKTGKVEPVAYQEMIAVGNVRVRKQGEFVGDADRVTYDESKGTLTFHGSDKNPAVVNKLKGQGVRPETMEGQTIIYYVKSKTFEVIRGTRFNQ